MAKWLTGVIAFGAMVVQVQGQAPAVPAPSLLN